MTLAIFDDNTCNLGEGAFWHPLRQQFFWFDIVNCRLYTKENDITRDWRFAESVSAAGWVSKDILLIASETGLLQFDVVTGASDVICPLEADKPYSRSNDGRADPWGGFWIGTMGKNAELEAGAIYRYFKGELRQLYSPITIPNAICFSPDWRFAYFSDTVKAKVWRQTLAENEGWPLGEPELFLDCTSEGLSPDGAVVDAEGYFWNAQWGNARVARYAADGSFVSQVPLPTDHITCPAFGGPDLTTLFITSATQGLSPQHRNEQPDAGKTFVSEQNVTGQKEHQIRLI